MWFPPSYTFGIRNMPWNMVAAVDMTFSVQSRSAGAGLSGPLCWLPLSSDVTMGRFVKWR